MLAIFDFRQNEMLFLTLTSDTAASHVNFK